MPASAVIEPEVERRLGIDWCTEHKQPVAICCGGTGGKRQPHRWHDHNALRRYTTLMIKGKTHPFHEAGGPFVGAREGAEALAGALTNATTERVPLTSLIATRPVTAQHVGQMLRGTAPEPRTGNHPFESEQHPTVLRVGAYHVIADGHHRLASEWARGATHARARVLSGVTPLFQNANDLMLRPA